MAFDSLSERLQGTLKKVSGQGRLTEKNMEEMLSEIRLALLEADVNFQVVKEFIAATKEKALGQDVLGSLIITVKNHYANAVKRYLDEKNIKWEEIKNDK